jgi:hypothetical protein
MRGSANRLEAAQQESFHTCEVCGQPGELREDSWTKTLPGGASFRPRHSSLCSAASVEFAFDKLYKVPDCHQYKRA